VASTAELSDRRARSNINDYAYKVSGEVALSRLQIREKEGQTLRGVQIASQGVCRHRNQVFAGNERRKTQLASSVQTAETFAELI
jgi:hypothetical protein